MTIRITSGPARIIHQGMATAFGGNPLRMDVELEDGVRVGVEFQFTADPDVPDVDVRSAWHQELLHLELVNFDAADGRGSAEPVLLGEIGGDLVFVHFRVFRFGRTEDRTVHYSFYRVSPQTSPK